MVRLTQFVSRTSIGVIPAFYPICSFHFEFGRGGHAQWSGVDFDAIDSESS
jgi:hypothetical protein